MNATHEFSSVTIKHVFNVVYGLEPFKVEVFTGDTNKIDEIIVYFPNGEIVEDDSGIYEQIENYMFDNWATLLPVNLHDTI